MAAGVAGIVVADSGGVDWVVKRKSGSFSPQGHSGIEKRKLSVKERRSEIMRDRIAAAIRKIPKGKVSTYGAIARAAGFPGAARFVARVLGRGFGLPWQRVLGAGGEIKLRGDNAMEQRFRLEAEGVRFRGKRVDMKQCEYQFARADRKR
jgi:methylated-DNA-protein-cysteine methyltransferase-like protein